MEAEQFDHFVFYIDSEDFLASVDRRKYLNIDLIGPRCCTHPIQNHFKNFLDQHQNRTMNQKTHNLTKLVLVLQHGEESS